MKKYLIVDDEKDTKSLFDQRFRKEVAAKEAELFYSQTAEEALSYLAETHEPHIILSDINMPGMNGLIFLKIVKEKYPQHKVIMITAYADEFNIETAKKEGADGFINKPIDFMKLKEFLSVSICKSIEAGS
ncbi:MAG: response regulator [Parachlamydiaceae bacterium]